MPSESKLYGAIRLKASALGGRLYRNNVGLFYTKTGELTRCGLAEGSSDLIGWMTYDGRAIFAAVEVKRSASVKAKKSQQLFIAAVRRSGGFACVVSSVDEFENEWRKYNGL